MEALHELFSIADPVFYDVPHRLDAEADVYAQALRVPPPDWNRANDGPWTVLGKSESTLPEQGWKIHVASSLEHSERTIGIAWSYCTERGISFKFLRSRNMNITMNAKYANRGSSGKLIAIYPADEATLRSTLDDLNELLSGVPGPYILSDLRWRNGPLYLRYGAFAKQFCFNESGERVLALRGPSGQLEPDVRGTVFSVPDWAPIPVFIEEQMKAVADSGGHDFPFDVEKSLHFSNGGGVYLAKDRRDGRRVVLREARPYAGLDTEEHDAVHRLMNEQEVLTKLSGLDFVPKIYGCDRYWDHYFIVEEYIEGRTLEAEFNHRYPLIKKDPPPTTIRAYTQWALYIIDDLASMLEEIHKRGIVFGDLHPGNVIIRPDGRCALVDFESSFSLAAGKAASTGAAGFVSRAARSGTQVDEYALASMRLFLFLPYQVLLEL
ncbi:MAG: protein kinase domain-containing protein, partial [Trebonia sp.]